MKVSLVVLGLGCGKSQDAPTTGSAAAGSGSAVPKTSEVTAKLDGKPVAIDHALVKRLPDGRAQLYVGTGGTCDELMTNVFDGRNPHVLIDLPMFLLADGGDSLGVGDVYAGPSAKSDPQAKATLRGDLVKGEKVPIDLAVTSQEAKLEVRGTVTAEVCGDQDPLPPPSAGAATMKIANRAFIVRAALKHGDDLELVDQPRDCTSAKYIGVRLRRERGTWRLDGARISVELSGPAPGLHVAPADVKESPGPGHVMVELSGTDKLAAYSVVLAGVVDATDCNYVAK